MVDGILNSTSDVQPVNILLKASSLTPPSSFKNSTLSGKTIFVSLSQLPKAYAPTVNKSSVKTSSRTSVLFKARRPILVIVPLYSNCALVKPNIIAIGNSVIWSCKVIFLSNGFSNLHVPYDLLAVVCTPSSVIKLTITTERIAVSAWPNADSLSSVIVSGKTYSPS